jgi:hypothetical protein
LGILGKGRIFGASKLKLKFKHQAQPQAALENQLSLQGMSAQLIFAASHCHFMQSFLLKKMLLPPRNTPLWALALKAINHFSHKPISQSTSLPAYQPASPPAYSPTCLLAYLPIRLLAYSPTHLFAYLPTCLLAYCLLAGCANPVQPTGGPKDEIAPRLDSLRSTRNYQTQFKKQTIVLAFNEWVELRDVFNQVVISPPLEYRADIARKKKTIQVNFDEREVLRENATYVINFGQAIRDITEGNAAPAVFVFSTGDYIDSLSVEGKIVDAFSGQPAENVLFMLYENLADSVVRKERPFYFARTDKQGVFKVNNVKSGIFKGVALLDQNLNYRFDTDAEKIGFLDSALVLTDSVLPQPPADTSSAHAVDSLALEEPTEGKDTLVTLKTLGAKVFLRLFSEEKHLFLRSKETATYGVVKLVFSREPFDAVIGFDTLGQKIWQENVVDTVRIWYDLPQDTAWNVYVKRDNSADTVHVRTNRREAFLNSATLNVAAGKQSDRVAKQHLQKPFNLKFNHPLNAFHSRNIELQEDTAKLEVRPAFQIDTSDRRTLQTLFSWKENVQYQLVIFPGGVTDIYGLTNADTIRQVFTAAQKKDLGTLNLTVTGLQSNQAYVIRVLGQNNTVIGRFEVAGDEQFQFVSGLLAPDTYTVEIIEDLDRNGRWTTGNYDLHRQPERVLVKKLEQLRANWELAAKVEAVFE